ncbi:hypothetical protein [Lichenibacterium dinghuense]|uniref:hypothetical protein n=1 Tax=Lichenibacterium dinghuense TaxID=2895977 RepID=UPI001F250B47|nr:hypothetical protein [Lichenibacterium sp. 6Y81]
MSASTRARHLCTTSLIGSALAGMVAVTGRAQPVPSDGPSASMTCPPVFQSGPAQRAAVGLVRRLEPQVATLGAASAVTVVGRELGSALRRELPSGDYLANQRAIGAVDRSTIALCFPRLGALIAEMDRQGTDSSRYAAAQQAATLRRQQDIEAAAERDRQAEQDRQRREDARVAAQVAAAERQEAEEEGRRRAAPVEVPHPLPDRNAAFEEARRARDALLHPAGDEEAKARANFFAHSVPTPPVPGASQTGEPNPWAEALKQLMTPPPDADQPGGRLVGAYRDYIAVRRCFDSRSSFAAVYVTPAELDAAKAQVKAIEDELLKQTPGLDKDERWATANRLNGEVQRNLIVRMDPGQQAVARGEYTAEGRAICRSAVTGLRDDYEKIDPTAKNLRKDF